MKVVIIAGSKRDQLWVKAIVEKLPDVPLDIHYLSAHKQPLKLLEVIQSYPYRVVFITVAGRSNALSGMVAANTDQVVIACPPLETTADYLADIHSSLRMPSETPVLTILGTDNCADAVKRIMRLRESVLGDPRFTETCHPPKVADQYHDQVVS